jgi:hypothetical protein
MMTVKNNYTSKITIIILKILILTEHCSYIFRRRIIIGIINGATREPEIKSVYDLKSQERNSQLTPGHMFEISGSKLKLEQLQADEGIFLINVADNSEIKIEHIHIDRPSKLSGMLPDTLPSGSYTLVVRNRQGGNKSLSNGVFNEILVVN